MVTGTSLGLNSYLTIFKREHESLTYKNTSTVSKYRQEEKLFFFWDTLGFHNNSIQALWKTYHV